ncbi:uncharacterized protein PFL1_00618 [Pseudozyma flocculosa PF-1]|uniref:uncharacterized protein n=1 Tax=Pseudozyma flocculosa PF-1 TaxID=1277687 RepID=UPI000456176F|nr:uncharacterized protein PFL1_00618 [Pseudozyma flocculosa PF-1]EPQ32422.1 hypothetical protein PFL1_00618 [Pseudozyma flocculosa PF-1]
MSEDTSSRQRSRNAQAQADLRARRKQYIKSLEGTVAALESCVRQLRVQNHDLYRQVDEANSIRGGPSSSSSSSMSPPLQSEQAEALASENRRLHQLLAEVGLAAAASAKLARVGKDLPYLPSSNDQQQHHQQQQQQLSYIDAAEAARIHQVVEASLNAGGPQSYTAAFTAASASSSSSSASVAASRSTPRWTDSQSIQAKHRRVSEAKAFANETRFQLGLQSSPDAHSSSFDSAATDVDGGLKPYPSIDVTTAAPLFPPQLTVAPSDATSIGHGASMTAIPDSNFDPALVFLQTPGHSATATATATAAAHGGANVAAWDPVGRCDASMPSSAPGARALSDTAATMSPAPYAASSSSSSIAASPLQRGNHLEATSWPNSAYGVLASPSGSHSVDTMLDHPSSDYRHHHPHPHHYHAHAHGQAAGFGDSPTPHPAKRARVEEAARPSTSYGDQRTHSVLCHNGGDANPFAAHAQGASTDAVGWYHPSSSSHHHHTHSRPSTSSGASTVVPDPSFLPFSGIRTAPRVASMLAF